MHIRTAYENHFDVCLGLEACIANAATGLSRDGIEFVEDDEEHQGENIYVPGKVRFEACPLANARRK